MKLNLTLHNVELAPYSSLNITNHERPNWILSHVLWGDVRTGARGDFWRARGGDVMVHPPNIPFSENSNGPGTHQWFGFDLQIPPQIDLFRLHPVSPVVTLQSPKAYSQTFGKLLDVWISPVSTARDLRLSALTIELFALVLDSWNANGAPPRPDNLQTAPDRFLEIIAYMEGNLDQKLTRDDLAARAFLHPGYFDRVFRAAYGASPMQMLRDLRLRRAQTLLETTNDSLDSITHACGFGDSTNFSRVFRAQFGKAPGQYRQSVNLSRESYIQQ